MLNVNYLDWFRPFVYQVIIGDEQFVQLCSWKTAKILTVLIGLTEG